MTPFVVLHDEYLFPSSCTRLFINPNDATRYICEPHASRTSNIVT